MNEGERERGQERERRINREMTRWTECEREDDCNGDNKQCERRKQISGTISDSHVLFIADSNFTSAIMLTSHCFLLCAFKLRACHTEYISSTLYSILPLKTNKDAAELADCENTMNRQSKYYIYHTLDRIHRYCGTVLSRRDISIINSFVII